MTAPARARTRTTKGPEELRADLLTAAAQLFADRAFSSVTIADITTQAGVATGTFYRYFGSKDDVLVQLRREVLDELLRRAGEVLVPADPDDWWAAAERMIDATLRFWFEDSARSRVVLRGDFTDDAAHAEAALSSTFASGIALGQDLGVVDRDIEPATSAGLLLHGATGLVYHAIVDDQVNDPGPLIAHVTLLAHRLLGPRVR